MSKASNMPPSDQSPAAAGYRAPGPTTDSPTPPDILPVGLLLATNGGIWRLSRNLTLSLICDFDPSSLPYVTDIASITVPSFGDIYWACAKGPSAGAYTCQNDALWNVGSGQASALSFYARPDDVYAFAIVDANGVGTLYAAPTIQLGEAKVASNLTPQSQSLFSRTCQGSYTSSTDGIYYYYMPKLPPESSPSLLVEGPVTGLAMGDVEPGQQYNPLYWFDPTRNAIFRMQITNPRTGGPTSKYLDLAQPPASQLGWHPALGLIWVEDNGAGSNVVAEAGTGTPQIIYTSPDKIYCAMPDAPRTEP